jgi:hypothetical protein
MWSGGLGRLMTQDIQVSFGVAIDLLERRELKLEKWPREH